MKEIIKHHKDCMTVQEALQKMQQDYAKQGYNCTLKLNTLKIKLDDGYVMIWWQDGVFWQECFAE